jgi:DNA helicase HerA-like ATPase
MARSDSTYIGQVASVATGIVRVKLRDDVPSTIALIDGESYRIGQIGAFLRIPLGYAHLYAVCTQVGADALPASQSVELPPALLDIDPQQQLAGYRWMTVVLFGEAIGSRFERGVSQYPTVGDEVHLVTNADLRIIYSEDAGLSEGTLNIGSIAASSGIDAKLKVNSMVSRHIAIVGSTGSGKSNLVTVLLESLAASQYKSARVLVIDPHGEYASALGGAAQVFRINPDPGQTPLQIPFWALPFDELRELTLGGLQPNHEASIREIVLDMKLEAAKKLATPPPAEAITADSPIPFSIRRLWYELDRFERMTFTTSGTGQSDANLNAVEATGDPNKLIPDRFPASNPYNQAPYKNSRKRNIERQLDLMANRLRDGRYSFLFQPGAQLSPSLDGAVAQDLDALVAAWVGHPKPVTILDVSGTPSEILPTIVGTLVRIVYDILFWAGSLPISGRNQPLLVVVDEAHRFVPEKGDSSAHRILSMVAKEGRKYGVGLAIVTQRPSEIDSTILSQCGSMIALRLTNDADRSKIAAVIPDDLGGLLGLLPSLRTGEALCVGEVISVPSRIRVRKATNKPVGNDPITDKAWQQERNVQLDSYKKALQNWREQIRT